MTKIILKNADAGISVCVNPLLIKVEKRNVGGTDSLVFELQNGSLNPPMTTPPDYSNITFQRFESGVWQSLQGLNYTSYQYIWTNPYGHLPIGTLVRVIIRHSVCGESISNAVAITL